MKSSSILVPVILIVCLLALALLISQAFASVDEREVLAKDSVNSTKSPKQSVADSATLYGEPTDASAESAPTLRDLVPVTSAESGRYATTGSQGADEGYFVIAGTFRQEINARTRVRDLRQAGFSTTEVTKFDRGTYAVALVSRSGDYGPAADMAQRVRAAGFESMVYRKR